MSKKDNLTIKEQLEAIEAELAWFDGPDFNVDQALERYKRLEGKSKKLQEHLVEMKNQIDVLSSLHTD